MATRRVKSTPRKVLEYHNKSTGHKSYTYKKQLTSKRVPKPKVRDKLKDYKDFLKRETIRRDYYKNMFEATKEHYWYEQYYSSLQTIHDLNQMIKYHVRKRQY